MPVPTAITDLSTSAAGNSPAGSDAILPDLDNYIRALSAFIAQNYADKLPKAGGTMTGALALSGAPTVDLHAATKKYVDDKTENISFRAQASNITSAGVVTAWTEKEDIGDCFSGGYFTPPKDGTYLFTADAIIGSNTVSGVWQMLISDDGGAFITQASGFVSVSSSAPTSGGSLSCSSVVRLTAGNKVKLSFPALPVTPKIAYVFFSGALLHE